MIRSRFFGQIETPANAAGACGCGGPCWDPADPPGKPALAAADVNFQSAGLLVLLALEDSSTRMGAR